MDDIYYWLALLRVPGIGPVHYRELLSHYGHPREIFARMADDADARAMLPAAARTAILQPDWRQIESDARWTERPDAHLLALDDARYPPLLKQIHDAPPVLFVLGDTTTLAEPQLAIVGSRNPTAGGCDTAAEFAADLARRGLTITSGLAIGIDAAAHRGALRADGRTVAVAATGLDQVYPPRHAELARQISRQGALVSEFPPGSEPLPECFPRRNRLISGLSLGTLVVEATPRSGSLITARAALEQGREVFAVPGSIHNARARGCHALIRQGAKLVECTDDVLEEIRAFRPAPRPGMPALLRAGKKPRTELAGILEHIDFAPTTIDTLVERTGLAAERLYPVLLELELCDDITAIAGGAYIRRKG